MRTNRLILDSTLSLYQGLSVPTKTENDFRKFTNSANLVEVLVPFGIEYTFYGIAQPKSDRGNHKTIDRHRGVYVGQESIDGITFNKWHFTPQALSVSSVTATKLQFVAEFMQITDERFLGTEYVPSGSTVDEWLKSRYPEAVDTNIVRVVSEDADFQFNGTDWIELVDKERVLFYTDKSDVFEWNLEQNNDAGFPDHDPTTSELIFSELDDRVTYTYLETYYLNEIEVNDQFYRLDGSKPLQGTMDANDNDITNVKEITLRDAVDGQNQVARMTYQNSDGNNYQVVRIEYPDGRVEEINETFEYNYRYEAGGTANSGNVIMTDGTTQGAQAVRGFLFDETSPNAKNLVGVVTVDGITNFDKSKATYRGIVKGVALSTLYASGTTYAEGQILYARGGTLSNVAPSKPNTILRMGAIINQTGSTFDVIVAPLLFQRFDELSDSNFTHTDGHVPMSNGSTLENYNLSGKVTELENKDTDLQNQITTLESGIDWKESVATFADLATTYPDAEKGDTVYVEDEEKVYIFNGTNWVSYASFILSGTDGASKVGSKDGFGGTNVQQQLDNAKVYIDNQDALKIDKDFSSYNEITVALSDDDEVLVRDVSTNETKKTKVSNLLQKGSDVYEYGVREVVGQSDPTFERVKKVNGEMTVGVNTGLVANVGIDDEIVENTFDNIAIFNRVRETIISDNGVTQQSNVMVRVNKYYIKEEWKTEGGTDYHYLWMSDKKLTGYRLPLPFDNGDGTEKDFVYLSAYEGFVDSNNILRSVSGELPAHTITRSNFRNYARNNDTNDNTSAYLIQDIQDAVDLIQIPIWIEFAEKNSDEGIGRGVVGLTFDATTVADGTTTTAIVSNAEGANFTVGMTVYVNSEYVTIQSIVADIPIAGQTTITFEETLSSAILTGANLDPRQWKTGYCDNVVASTGFFRANDGKHPFVWRGMENVWGNIWKFVDGIKISDWYTWVCTDFTQYNDDASDVNGDYALPFVKLNYQNALSNGYIKELGFDSSYPFVKTPIEVGAGSTTYYSDYYYQNSGDRTALLGGFWYFSSFAGLSFWYFNSSLSSANFDFSARLSHRP